MPTAELNEATKAKVSWSATNQAYLGAEFERIKEALRSGTAASAASPSDAADRELQRLRAGASEPFAIDRLSEIFDLSSFERGVLLLCAGVEMDAELAGLCEDVNGHAEATYATFTLAMTALDDVHWSALTPYRPLRRYRLLEVDQARGLTSGALRLDERVLHYLAGVNLMDPRLEPLLELAAPPRWIAESHKTIGDGAALHCLPGGRKAPLLHLRGDDSAGQEDTAAYAAQKAGLNLWILRAEDLPSPGPELDLIIQLWRRESRMLPGALLLHCGASGLTASARHLAEMLPAPLFLATRDAVRPNRPVLRFDIDKPNPVEQKQLWSKIMADTIGPSNQDQKDIANRLAEQFRLSARAISRTVDKAPTRKLFGSGTDFSKLWDACRALSRPKLEDLAQRLDCSAGWGDLILPEAQLHTLRLLAAHVRQRMVVYENWGFSAKGRRGLGVSALLTGESGTGKTLAAEVLAHELAVDLYRVDLSSVVSKYIGESEKNLRQIFDAAEEGGVALLFDEADALFGKRTEVKDSHDRYANISISYLLQRMEAYQGVAILTTNFRSALDRAFLRRLSFTINFPFPDALQREEMWRKAFPARTPTVGLDPRKLAQLHIAGGNIRNIALHAAFLAADAGEPVTMGHLLEATRSEAQKIERPLSDSEIRGWV